MSTAINAPNGDRNPGSSTAGDRGQTARTTGSDAALGHREVLAREKEEFGGMKFGAGFFGWLAATGMAVLLTALVAAVGTGLGYAGNIDPANPGGADTRSMGLAGGVILLVIILVSYFCGGYVAGRMARFDGVKQGIAVWLWAIIVAVVVAVIAFIAGSQSNLLANLNGFPAIGVNQNTLTTAGIITAVAMAVISLIGAILGGLAGMRFHRKVDRAGVGR